MEFVVLALVVLAVYAAGFLATAGVSWVVFWCFGLPWSWPAALGVWIVLLAARWVASAAESGR